MGKHRCSMSAEDLAYFGLQRQFCFFLFYPKLRWLKPVSTLSRDLVIRILSRDTNVMVPCETPIIGQEDAVIFLI